MIIVDILSLNSFLKILFSFKNINKIYYVMESQYFFDRLSISILKLLNYKVISLEYEIKHDLKGSNHVDICNDLKKFTKENITPKIEKILKCCSFFSEYEIERLQRDLELVENKSFYRFIEIIFIAKILKNDIGWPKEVLLSSTRWQKELICKYKQNDLKLSFYKVLVPFKLKPRGNYLVDNLVVETAKLNLSRFIFISNFIRKFLLEIYHVTFRNLLRFFKWEVSEELGSFDIVALVPGHDGLEWFHNLAWKKEFNILSVVYGSNKALNEDYISLSNKWITYDKEGDKINNMVSVFSFFDISYIKRLTINLFCLIKTFPFHKTIPNAYIFRIIELWVEVSKWEEIFRLTGSKVLFTNVEGDYIPLAANLAINRAGGVTVGSSWSLWADATLFANKNIMDVLLPWGEVQEIIWKERDEFCRAMLKIGYIGDYYLKDFLIKANNLRDEWGEEYNAKFIVTYYDNVFSKDMTYNYSEVMNYFENLTLWVKDNPSSLLVLKSKREKIIKMYPDSVRKTLGVLKQNRQLVYIYDKADLSPGLASDVIVALNLATLPCLLAGYGKNVILRDIYNSNEKRQMKIDTITFVETSERLYHTLDQMYEKKIDAKDCKIELKTTGSKIDPYVDGKSSSRIASYLLDLLANINDGNGSDVAIELANNNYSKRYGLKNENSNLNSSSSRR